MPDLDDKLLDDDIIHLNQDRLSGIDIKFFTSRAQNTNAVGNLQEFCQEFNLELPKYDIDELNYGSVKQYRGSVFIFFSEDPGKGFLSSKTFIGDTKKDLRKKAAADLWDKICYMALNGELGKYVQVKKESMEEKDYISLAYIYAQKHNLERPNFYVKWMPPSNTERFSVSASMTLSDGTNVNTETYYSSNKKDGMKRAAKELYDKMNGKA